VAFQLQVEASQGPADDTAANTVKVCSQTADAVRDDAVKVCQTADAVMLSRYVRRLML
jgi:hypothetical protein